MKRRWYLTGTAALFAADQVLKALAEQNLEKNEERKLAGPVVIRRVGNKGMCMGLLSGQPETVRILSLAASAAVSISGAVSLLCGKRGLRKAGSCLAAAGAWSNTADRFIRGHVVDYIGFRLKNARLASLTYNLADFFIAAGALLISLDSVRSQLLPHRDSRRK